MSTYRVMAIGNSGLYKSIVLETQLEFNADVKDAIEISVKII